MRPYSVVVGHVPAGDLVPHVAAVDEAAGVDLAGDVQGRPVAQVAHDRVARTRSAPHVETGRSRHGEPADSPSRSGRYRQDRGGQGEGGGEGDPPRLTRLEPPAKAPPWRPLRPGGVPWGDR